MDLFWILDRRYMPPANKYVYDFGDGRADGGADLKELLGGKGAGLAEMSRLDLPVPPGFTLTTEVCETFQTQGGYPAGLREQVQDSLQLAQRRTKKVFGDPDNPLLVSVRSGGPTSLPGMMDTLLNVGLNDQTVKGLEAKSGMALFAYDSYRRFIEAYSDLVLKVDVVALEDARDAYMDSRSILRKSDMTAEDWKAVIALYKDIIQEATGNPFPQDPQEQLWGAIDAVFKSSMNPRAIALRAALNVDDPRTGVTVQSMVFGNYGDNSASGVVYTRNPFDGADRLFGNYMVNAPGTDVVEGKSEDNPHPQVTAYGRRLAGSKELSFEERFPKAFRQLQRLCIRVEANSNYMQAVEFTMQDGEVFLLQTRDGKCSPEAEQNFLVKMAEDGMITMDDAVARADVSSLPVLDRNARRETLGYGTPAASGAGTGQLVFHKEAAVRLAAQGIPVILCRVETDPDDVDGVIAAQGVITTKGGRMSHAACVARGLRKPCLVSLGAEIDPHAKTLTFPDGRVIKAGQVVTVDGNGVKGKEAELILGDARKVKPALSEAARKLIAWGDVRSRRPGAASVGVEEAYRLRT